MALSPLLLTCLATLFPDDVSGHMLYLLHKGETTKACEVYVSQAEAEQSHDFSLLQQAAVRLLEEGMSQEDPEVRLMCLFGAGVSVSTDLLHILEKGIQSKEMRAQLVALSYLGRLQDDEADALLIQALGSPFLIVRLEALLQLAGKSHPAAMGQFQSLIVKVPPILRAVFPQIIVHLDGLEANRQIHQLLNDAEIGVRLEMIGAVAKEGRDDFLPTIRLLSAGADHAEQEACAFAFGSFQDHSALPFLKNMAKSVRNNVQLAASIALCKLGEKEYQKQIELMAQSGSLFAIAALGNQEGTEEILRGLLLHPNRDVRLNAILSLLKKKDPAALPHLSQVLVTDSKDLGYNQIRSPGGSLQAWKTVPSANAQTKGYVSLQGQTASLREAVLTQCIEFEEEAFLQVAQLVLDKRLNSLVPLLMDLLQNRKSEATLAFLHRGYQQTGAPFVRNYCALSLYKLKEEGSYEKQLSDWVKARGSYELIRFREQDDALPFTSTYELTPEETSRFLVDACQALASSQNLVGLETLLYTISHGNPKNRYALAGLLMRTTE